MGVWIETTLSGIAGAVSPSHPVWVCGLKQAVLPMSVSGEPVTPCMGVWIETHHVAHGAYSLPVTPCMGVWIETALSGCSSPSAESHPVWVCGLKLVSSARVKNSLCHTLYGCVD